MEKPEGASRFAELGKRAEAIYEAIQQGASSTDDPRGAELGATLGEMYVACSCCAAIREEPSCQELRELMDEKFRSPMLR
jgi:hypothetical protein